MRSQLSSVTTTQKPPTSTPLLLQILAFMMPILAVAGHHLPVWGSFFAFRVATYLFLLITLLIKRNTFADPLRKSTFVLVIVWCITLGVQLLVFPGMSNGSTEMLTLSSAFSLLLAVSLAPDPRILAVRFLWGWLFSVLVTAVIALTEVLFGTNLSTYDLDALSDWGTTATFGNPNDFAAYLLLSLPILCTLLAVTRARLPVVAVIALIPVLAFSTGSVTGRVVVVVFFLLLAVFTLVKWPHIATPLILVATVFVLASFKSIAVAVGLSTAGAGETSFQILGWEIPVDRSTYIRLNLAWFGIQLFMLNPIIGIGAGAFETHASTQEFDLFYGVQSPHNGFVEILAQFGLIVFIPFLIWLVTLLKSNFVTDIVSPVWASTGVKYPFALSILSLPLIFTMGSSMVDNSVTWAAFATLLLVGLSMRYANHSQNLSAFQETPTVIEQGLHASPPQQAPDGKK